MEKTLTTEAEVVAHAVSGGKWSGDVLHHQGWDYKNQEFQKSVDDEGFILSWRYSIPEEFRALWQTTYTASVLQKMQSLKTATSPKV